MERIVLVRHGRSAHVETGWLDVRGLAEWRERYDAAAILEEPPPPAPLNAIVRDAGVVVASDMPRAIASAERLVSGGREFLVSPLMREVDMHIPFRTRARLPLTGWMLMFGAWFLWRRWKGHRPPPHLLQRADEAAAWLEGLAREHASVVAVTHASFRSILAGTLASRGWAPPRSRSLGHWSAWELTRGPGG